MWLDRPAYITAIAAAVVAVGVCATQQLTAAQPVEPTLSSGAGTSAGAVRSARASQAVSAPSNHPVEPRAAWEAIIPTDDYDAALRQRSTSPGPLQSVHDLRVKKCRLIVERFYPNSRFAEHIEFFIAEHERPGMGEEWWWSLAYGAANCSLRCNVRFRNGCAGPMDRPGGPTNPQANIRAHCREWVRYYRRGIVGYQAARHVFYPRRPHDWLPGYRINYMYRTGKHGRIWQHHIEHLRLIEAAYREELLP